MQIFKNSLFILFVLLINISFSQEKGKIDEKTKNYFKDVQFENDNYKITLYNIVGRFEYIKFAVKIENKTSDIIIWNTKDSKVSYAGGEKSPVKSKIIKISPFKSKMTTFMVKGGTDLLVDDFKFIQKGLSKVSVDGKVRKIEDFKLPESKNNITTDDFKITLKKSKKKTDETYAKFELLYTGEDVAVISLNNINVRVNENDEFANNVKKDNIFILTKGQKMSFLVKFHIPARVVDMQFADMFIQWNNTFTVSKAIKINGIQTTVILDKELTKEKN